MIIKKKPYNNEHGYEFLDQKRKRKEQEMRKLIHKFDIKTDELGLQVNSLSYVSQDLKYYYTRIWIYGGNLTCL